VYYVIIKKKERKFKKLSLSIALASPFIYASNSYATCDLGVPLNEGNVNQEKI